LKALVLNNDLGSPRISHVTINFYNTRGGGVYSTLRVETMSLDGWNH